MTQSFRRLMMIVEGRLDEFDLVSTGGKPPVATGDGDGPGRRPEGGEYWFRAGYKIPVSGTAPNGMAKDFATEPFLAYDAFGFDPQALLAWLEARGPQLAGYFRRYLAATRPELGMEAPDDNFQQSIRRDPSLLFSSSGCRSAAIAYALSLGWAYIQFNEHEATLWLDAAQKGRVVKAAGGQFPMMAMERIQLVLPSGGDAFKNQMLTFHREDSPGFAGAFGALSAWAGGDAVPEQDWIFTRIGPGDEARLDAAGLHPKREGVTMGNAYYRDCHVLPYAQRRGSHALRGQPGAVYRFPASVANKLALQSATSLLGEPILFSKQPFVVPASVVQRWVGGRWTPLAG